MLLSSNGLMLLTKSGKWNAAAKTSMLSPFLHYVYIVFGQYGRQMKQMYVNCESCLPERSFHPIPLIWN